MSKRRLDNWIKAYLEYTKDSQSPLQFHFWTAIATISGALRRHVFFDQLHFKWHPNFYIIFVAKPGVANKSTTIDIGMQILSRLEGVFFGPESTTWQSLVQQMAESKSIVDYGDGVLIPQCAITVPVGEFGTFFNSKDNQMTDHLVSLWDGKKGKFEKKTKTSGSDEIINPWISIITGTTPSWLKSNFPDYMIGGGFMSRCIFVHGVEPRKIVAYLKERKQEDRTAQLARQAELEQALLDDLYSISEMRGEFILDDEAYEYGEIWYNQLMKNPPQHLKAEMMQGYIQRKQAHVHKLAMVLACAESNDLILKKAHLEKAILMIDGLEKDLPKIFGSIGGTAEASITTEIYTYLSQQGPRDKSQIFKDFMHKYPSRFLDAAILTLAQAGMISSENGKNGYQLYKAKPIKE